VLYENVKEWFDLEGACPESRFMLRICKFQDDKKEQVPGVVHVDDTGRFQTVTLEANGSLYKLADEFYRRTGVPIILNTSFNVAGEPIVETPQDALNTILSTGIDYGVLGSKIVRKRREILFERNEVAWPERINSQIENVLKAATERHGGKASEAGQEPPLQTCVGTFEHDRHGRFVVEHEGSNLKATLSGGLTIRSKISSPLKRSHGQIFDVASGPMAGYKVFFITDARGRVNVLALLQDNRGRNSQFFFRAPARDETSYGPFFGKYEAADRVMNVVERNNRLCVSVQGQPDFELVRTSATEFYLKKLPGYGVEFKANASGVVVTAVVTMPNEIVLLEKTENT
jgi:hypothetical protein